jgi:hypothetical protein
LDGTEGRKQHIANVSPQTHKQLPAGLHQHGVGGVVAKSSREATETRHGEVRGADGDGTARQPGDGVHDRRLVLRTARLRAKEPKYMEKQEEGREMEGEREE